MAATDVPLGPRLAAEAFGTFVLVGGGTGAVALDATTGAGLGTAGVAAAFGIAVAVAIVAVGPVSGAHLNPAVSLALAVARRFPPREVASYAAAQATGALVASAALLALLDPADLGATHPAGVAVAGAWAVEAVLTLLLVVVVLAVAADGRGRGAAAALAVGSTVAVAALVMGPVTGASMNPARSLGPAVVGADGADLWLYLTAPPAGALLAALLAGALRPWAARA
jgi:aquaporin NIP